MGEQRKGPAKDDAEFWNFASLVHFPSVYAAALVGFVASLMIVVIYPPAGEKATLSGALIDQFWLPEIVAAIWFGRFLYQRVPSRMALLAWVPPALFLISSVLEWHNPTAQYDFTWNTYFGRNCSGSECLYEMFLTMPFYTGIGYSLGALLCRVREQRSL